MESEVSIDKLRSSAAMLIQWQDKAALEAALQQKYIELLEKRIGQLETVISKSEIEEKKAVGAEAKPTSESKKEEDEVVYSNLCSAIISVMKLMHGRVACTRWTLRQCPSGMEQRECIVQR